ncbi:c-type cytochrome [Desulforhopalus sp. IMCC35007]|uniref:c-type cytochrome n=1 Tax=Desulforhopalus sp. IMCC35007 TaxID=2569543 RepID=UPI0010AECC85|nr:c-type cytochrome [Desulforhopalus sp. IMCC35007]TKB06478.1 cytochrome c [Desulforhopalus sp. IMCC35007]
MKSNITSLCLMALLSLVTILTCSTLTWSAEPLSPEQLYTANCARCHGHEGEGFLKVYPPIHNSRFLKEDVSHLPCIIRNGLRGEITVGDTTFNQIMPAMTRVTTEEMTAIIGFMQQKWNHPTTELQVEQWLSQCNSQ